MHTKCFFSVYILINFNTKIKFLVFRHTKILFFILEVKYTIKPIPLSDISETENLFHCVGRNATALIYCRRCRYPKSKYIYIYTKKFKFCCYIYSYKNYHITIWSFSPSFACDNQKGCVYGCTYQYSFFN